MNKRALIAAGRCNYRNWPIRRQLMISFLSTTLVLQLIIICVIFVIFLSSLIDQINLNVMKESTNSKVYDKVNERTQLELQNVAMELGNSYQAHLYQMTSILNGFKQMFLSVSDPLNSDIYLKNSTYETCSNIQGRDYSKLCFYIPEKSSKNFDSLTLPIQEMLTNINGFNDLLPSYITPYLRTKIWRIGLLIENTQDQAYFQMIYPAQEVNNQYFPPQQYWYQRSQKYGSKFVLTGKYQLFPTIKGPYLDQIYRKIFDNDKLPTLLSLTTFFTLEKTYSNLVTQKFNIYFQLELSTESLAYLFNQLNYMETAEICVTDISKNIIYAPNYWNANSSYNISKIYDVSKYSGIKIDNLIVKDMNVTIVQKQIESNDTFFNFEVVSIPLSGIFNSSQFSSFINEKTFINKSKVDDQTQTLIFLYAQQDEMLYISNLINTIIYHEETVIILLTMCSCINTIAIVFIFTYMVSVRISRPLRKLIRTAGMMSNSATSKNITMKIKNELDQIQAQSQIQDLIVAFKNLVESIEKRNNSQKQPAKAMNIQYPLNQYDPEFINKARGVSDINWQDLINEIEDPINEKNLLKKKIA